MSESKRPVTPDQLANLIDIASGYTVAMKSETAEERSVRLSKEQLDDAARRQRDDLNHKFGLLVLGALLCLGIWGMFWGTTEVQQRGGSTIVTAVIGAIVGFVVGKNAKVG